MIRIYKNSGELGVGKTLAKLPTQAEAMRQLAYRLYTLCERKNWAEGARAYNELITGWKAIEEQTSKASKDGTRAELFS